MFWAVFCLVTFLARDLLAQQVEVILRTPEETLTTGQKTKLAACITEAYPGVLLTNVEQFYCRRGFDDEKKEFTAVVSCQIKYIANLANAEAIDLDAQGKAGQILSTTDTHVQFLQHTDPIEATAAMKTKLNAFVSDVFAPITTNDIVDFACIKKDGGVKCVSAYDDVVPVSVWKTLKQQNPSPLLRVLKRIP